MHQAEISYAGYQPLADLISLVLFLFCKVHQEWYSCIQEQGWEKVCYFVYGKTNSFKHFSEKKFYLHVWKQREKFDKGSQTNTRNLLFNTFGKLFPNMDYV